MTEHVDEPLRFQLLGPVRVFRGPRPQHVGGERRRTLLAVLLSAHGRAVPCRALVDALWGEVKVTDPASSLQVALSLLRRDLNGPSDRSDTWVKSTGQEAALVVDEDACDSWRFLRLRNSARDADRAGDRATASAAYGQALAEWTGSALEDLRGVRFADDLAFSLEEARWATVEAKLEADLSRGSYGDAVDTATEYAVANPTRERLHMSWMMALYRQGRQSDALEVYARLREAMREQLRVEPGAAARRLQAAIVRQEDPGMDLPRARRLVSAPGHPSRGGSTTVVDVSASHVGRIVDERGRVLTLSGNRVTLGRESDNDVVVSTARTSRHHAVLQLTPLGWLAIDQNSTNGTLVNGEPIEKKLLRDGDVLTVGGMLFRFVF